MSKVRIKSRRGAVAPLVAILLVPLIAMLAFSVDIGYVICVKAQLQDAADAAALAGALQLMDPQFNGITNTSVAANSNITAAQTAAKKFALANTAGSTTLTLPAADIVVGYMATPTNQQQTLTAWSSGNLPNCIQVLLRRDSTANTPVSLFFARVLGINTWNGTATATAAFLQTSSVTGFNGSSSTSYGTLLPLAVDVNYWNAFLATGLSPDGTRSDSYTVTLPTTANSAPGNVTSGADGTPEFNNLYPNNTSPGNFGLIDIGPPANDTPTFRTWIDNGPSAADLSYFGSDGLQATPSAPATLKGGPGLKSTLVSNMADVVGQPRVVPLFSSYSGNGSNTQYTIVGFAGITIVSATGHGSNIQVVVQPITAVNPTATTGTGSGSSFVYEMTPISLVR
jgi:Flp pilus assembly protein TadG